MDKTTKPVSKTLINALEIAVARLTEYSDPQNPWCGVAPEAREASRLYIDSWVLEPLRAALSYARGERDWETVGYLEDLLRGFERNYPRTEADYERVFGGSR